MTLTHMSTTKAHPQSVSSSFEMEYLPRLMSRMDRFEFGGKKKTRRSIKDASVGQDLTQIQSSYILATCDIRASTLHACRRIAAAM